MVNDLTPEERLLRLIRGKTKRPKMTSHSETQAKIGAPRSSGLAMILNKFYRLSRIFTFNRIRMTLSIVIILSVGYLIFELVIPQPSLELEKLTSANRDVKMDKAPIEFSSSRPYSYYSQQIDTRDIFNAPFLSGGVIDASSGSSLGSEFSNLSIVGIVLDKVPQVIIEDNKDKKTYFLNKGDYIGEIKIEDILEGKVIISYAGEEFEMAP